MYNIMTFKKDTYVMK